MEYPNVRAQQIISDVFFFIFKFDKITRYTDPYL